MSANVTPSQSRRHLGEDSSELSARAKTVEEPVGKHHRSGPHHHNQRESVLVIDFGSQYSRLIARRVRESNVYCELIQHSADWDEVADLNPKGVILSGGPASVYDPGAPLAPSWVFDKGLPVLGICYGMQAVVHQLGGKVEPSSKREYGHAILEQQGVEHPVFKGLSSSFAVWMSHGDRIVEQPPGFAAVAHTENSPIAATSNARNVIGIQFHPEVVHTPDGTRILENFVHTICGCGRNWNPSNFIEDAVEDIRRQVGDGKVICALSGGVDSAVAASLVHRAIGDQLTCIFVNNGLMRRQEPDRIRDTIEDKMNIRFVPIDASKEFIEALSEVIDPEEKRHIVGEQFIKVFDKMAAAIGHVDFLAQGTLYPDVIESQTPGDNVSAKIKTHHNVGGLPEDMKLELVEPLRYLFKDEVRMVGLELGLAEEMVYRQPFPGPGLAIRVMGSRHSRETGHPPCRRLDCHGRDQGKRPIQRLVAELRGTDRHDERGRSGRLSRLRLRRRGTRSYERRSHDGGLGASAPRRAWTHLQPHRQRGAVSEPRRVRHNEQAARHHRVGMTAV